MPADQPAKPNEKRRWFHPTPGRLLVAVLVVEAVLLLSEPWLPKGWPVLIAIASLGAGMAVTLLWFVLALFFRWRFQFSLRSLLVLTVAVAATCSWMTVKMKQGKKQREVVGALQKMRARPLYSWEVDSSGGPVAAQPPGHLWLQTLLGDDFFFDVTSFVGGGSVVRSADLVLLKDLTHLKHINLTAADLTDDAWMEHLEGLGQLQDLAMGDNTVTDSGLKHLKGLKQLQTLFIDFNPITDSGLENLRGLKRLQTLCLSGTKVTDTGLKRLEGLSQLRSLSLDQTNITDVGLGNLEPLQQLRHLRLDSTKITDSGLEHLKGLKHLTFLSMAQTHVTDAGVAKLRKALPNALIEHSTLRSNAKGASGNTDVSTPP